MESIQQTFRYNVFISFRGEDTRKNFTSHLYAALQRHISYIFHDTLLPRGLGIAPQLSEAIKTSRIFLVVFSTNYADSKWCLNELSEMMMLCNQMKAAQRIILPVFLDVNQSDVVNQQGSYKEPFTKHETKFEHEMVQKWRNDLREAGQLPGLHLHDDANGNEEELVGQIVEKIRKLLHGQDVNEAYMDPPFVGIQPRMQQLISLLNMSCDDDDVRVITISGPQGIGKTEIAKATYDHLAINFKAQYCCFLPQVKAVFEDQPNGKVNLQKMLISNLVHYDGNLDTTHQGIRRIERIISNQKVLLVLDDVDNDEHLKILGMNRAIFGRGSRIVITTRDDSAVVRLKPDATYEPQPLDKNESMEVFCLNAFGQNQPKEEYEEVSREAVCWGAGRPGVLKHTAAHLRCFKSLQQWVWALKGLMHNSSC